MSLWQIWFIGSLILFILEIVIPGFVLACFGIGGMAAGLTAVFGMGVEIQITVFSVVTILVFITVRPFVVKHFYKSSENFKTNFDALIGKTGIVIQKIDPLNHKGRVKVGGEDWRGDSFDESIIENGKKIEVIKIEGSKLIVKPFMHKKED